MSGDRPTVVYDDDCGFCTWSVEHALARGEFTVIGFSELTDEQRDQLPEDYQRCSHLLTEEGVYSCGTAAEVMFAKPSFGFVHRSVEYC